MTDDRGLSPENELWSVNCLSDVLAGASLRVGVGWLQQKWWDVFYEKFSKLRFQCDKTR